MVCGFLLGGATVAIVGFLVDKIKKRHKRRSRVVGVIPARYKSTRFPGKPLVTIAGKPMIVRTWQQATKASKLDRVVVATDDERIAKACRDHGAEVVMTDEAIPNGTERCAQALERMGGKYDICVNIQGDEPLIEPEVIDEVVKALQDTPDAVYSTACTPLKHEEIGMRGRVKCITDTEGYAIYFSRGVIPHNKDGKVQPYPAPYQDKPYLLHLGLQCYDAGFLREFAQMKSTPLQLMEDLEQLKVIENGYKIKTVVVNHCAHGVDEPSDVASIEAIIKRDGLE
uniref:3-deoxy-manno-octulosonate cytidylyltransferase n=1 Tax=Tetraselmis sp. GSL018 TaxID=582737 RepID=A0A061R8E9_9CHLO|mmetsp:Transcript_42399/g.100619  ORF Transcript_42399/g.100619 Transcript_42399/m.100619 type:complete len:284 (+) Transcript_42399:112-963(+)